MKIQDPNLEEWRALYEAAAAVWDLAPWTFMEETEIFGVENPETGDLGFASVMGTLGDHYAVAVYLGGRGLHDFWQLESLGDSMRPEDVLMTPQLQASFEEPATLDEGDLDIIARLQLDLQGQRRWPQFRSYQPGYFPGPVSAVEARFLTLVLQQLVEMAPRIKSDPDILVPEEADSYLVRVRKVKGEGRVWHDEIRPAPEHVPPTLAIGIDSNLMDTVRGLPQRDVQLEVDLFLLPFGVGEPSDRAVTPYNLGVVDSRSGYALGFELLSTEPSVEAMYERIPAVFVSLLAKNNLRPNLVVSSRQVLLHLLAPPAQHLKIELAYSPVLPTLDPIKKDLIQHLRKQ
ncbi:MAG: hypothetical protein JXC32_12595 [Anaerolineae bacterium]|nr:hypothetical protein [Anaerolineae bacterium]